MRLKRLFSGIMTPGAIARGLIGLFLVGALTACHKATGMINPAGPIAHEERTLFFDAIAIMLIVVLPVIILSFAFARRYRDTHRDGGDYRPEWSHSTRLEVLWWGIPMLIILALGVLTWRKTHKLDPYRAIPVSGKILNVQVVALPWKWLFIYPDQHLASVNTLTIPAGRQVQFLITADAPMSAFFIPRLGSQIYAMAGMRTRLHLIASHTGTYQGLNSQFNGAGFSDMRFKVHAVAPKAFKRWVAAQQAQGLPILTKQRYAHMAQRSVADHPAVYKLGWNNLFMSVMHRYMTSHRPESSTKRGA